MPQEASLFRKGNVLHETYRIEELIGVGGTGEVYRAENLVSRRTVAIKVLKREFSSDDRFIDLMRRELLRDVSSDAVVSYYELLRTKEYGGHYFLVMEYIDGPSLAKLMAEGPVPPETILKIAKRMAAGLRAAHGAKVLHRDISPDNIILRGGDADRATLIDFGIAKDLKPDAHSVIQGGFAGKYQYVAPEQMDGKPVPQSDLYSLGLTLLAAARGKPPDLPDDLYGIRKQKDELPDLSDQPEPLRSIFAGLLAPDRADRFASALELEEALQGTSEGVAAGPRRAAPALDLSAAQGEGTPAAATPEAHRRRGRGVLVAAVGGLALIAIVAGAVAFGPARALLFGPSLPHADIYRLTANRGSTVDISGHAPSEGERDRLIEVAGKAGGGAQVKNGITLASGEPSEFWAEGIAELIGALTPLETWSLRVVEQRAVLEGTAPTEAVAEVVRGTARRAAERAQILLEVAIAATAENVAERVETVLAQHRDCGTLELVGGSESLAGQGAVPVSGRVADARALEDLRDSLREVLGDGRLSLDVEALNPHVCRFISLMAPTGGRELEIMYADGAGRPEAGDAFAPDANPVIDVAVAEQLSGRLYVLLVDNEGSVLNLLPHPGRQENLLNEIGEVAGGRRIVRVAYPQSEASPAKLSLSFTPPYGANLIVALVSQSPLFDNERLRRENIQALAPEFQRGVALAAERGEQVPLVYRLLKVGEKG